MSITTNFYKLNSFALCILHELNFASVDLFDSPLKACPKTLSMVILSNNYSDYMTTFFMVRRVQVIIFIEGMFRVHGFILFSHDILNTTFNCNKYIHTIMYSSAPG